MLHKAATVLLAAIVISGCTSETAPAQKAPAPAAASAAQATETPGDLWICTMDPQVRETKPGKCTICGMDLVKAEIWTCPMDPQVRETKPGKCSICGMDLVKEKKGDSEPGLQH